MRRATELAHFNLSRRARRPLYWMPACAGMTNEKVVAERYVNPICPGCMWRDHVGYESISACVGEVAGAGEAAGTEQARGAAVGDVNNDGNPELVMGQG